VRMRERRARLRSPILEDHHELVPFVRPQLTRTVAPDRQQPTELNRSKPAEARIVPRRVDDELAPPAGRRGQVAGRGRWWLGDERGKAVLEDGRFVRERELDAAGQTGQPSSSSRGAAVSSGRTFRAGEIATHSPVSRSKRLWIPPSPVSAPRRARLEEARTAPYTKTRLPSSCTSSCLGRGFTEPAIPRSRAPSGYRGSKDRRTHR